MDRDGWIVGGILAFTLVAIIILCVWAGVTGRLESSESKSARALSSIAADVKAIRQSLDRPAAEAPNSQPERR